VYNIVFHSYLLPFSKSNFYIHGLNLKKTQKGVAIDLLTIPVIRTALILVMYVGYWMDISFYFLLVIIIITNFLVFLLFLYFKLGHLPPIKNELL
jgi:hypothetical protein